MKQKIAEWRRFTSDRIAYWEMAEKIAARSGLAADAAHCASRRWQFMELNECLDLLDKAAA